MSDDDFYELKKLLKRVRGNFSKRQHCYTTAIQFSTEYAEQAVRLIYYGLEYYEDGWFSTYTSYLYIGRIYETVGNYQKAYDTYLLTKEALGSEHIEYMEELSSDLLWMRLHLDAFRYSIELEKYYSYCVATNEFSKSFINSELRLAIAQIVISLHYGELEQAKHSFAIAKKICKPNYIGKMYKQLIKHNYCESLKITPGVLEFLNSVQCQM